MRFWDSSALLPLLSEERFSDTITKLLSEDRDLTVWWGTWAECGVAISRLKREDKLDETGEEETRATLDDLSENWVEIEPEDDLRILAMLVSKDHPLKTADAFQLAAALRWCEGEPVDRDFICLDRRLHRAARDEGFHMLPGSLESSA